MNVFQEMPLNKAHFYERKAKQCLENYNKEEAATYYRLASEFMSRAMEMKYSVNIHPMLRLQYDNFIDCMSKCQEEIFAESISQTNSTSIIDPDKNNCVRDAEYQEQNDNFHKTPAADFHLAYLHKFDREPDSMLMCLHPNSNNNLANRVRKLPKADCDVIDELKVKNTELQNHVDLLMKSNEELHQKNNDLHQENKFLRSRICTLEREISILRKDSVESACINEEALQDCFTFHESIAFTD